MAVIHYNGKSTPLLVSETEFMRFMMERAGSTQWSTIHFIQNYIVTHHSTAEMIICKFTARVDFKNPNADISYSLKQFESDEHLKSNDIYGYAQKICTIIGYYLSRVHNMVNLKT